MRLLAAAASILLALSAPCAKAAVIDFSATGPATEDICARTANVSYCDYSKYLYGWMADYLLLNTYDFATSVSFTADPGTTFTPQKVDLLGGYSTLVRQPCDAACQADPDIYAMQNSGGFVPVVSDFLLAFGLKGGQVVASAAVDPSKVTTLGFGSAFSGIEQLVIAFSTAYPVPYEQANIVGSDGWLYTCLSSSCHNVGLDNLAFTTDAPVPLPAAGWLLLGGMLSMAAVARRRR